MKDRDIPTDVNPNIEDELLDVLEDDKNRPRYELQAKGDSLRSFMELTNIAEKLSHEDLNKIGSEAKQGYEYDLQSRVDWERDMDEWMRLATQVREPKNYPWPRASNVKYPLLTTAAMQFAARAYPSLIPSNGQVVKSTVIGKDPTGEKLELATKVDTYMSYQIMHEMHGWEEDMDKMLIMLPVIGIAFKKTFWDPVTEQNKSCLILPKNLVVNYWTESLETSERISERMEMSPRLVEERKRSGLFLNRKLGSPSVPPRNRYMYEERNQAFQPAANDETTPYEIIEQHTYLDLDNDGYKEPYIVTFDYASGDVLRITARFDDTTMFFNEKDELLKIEPIHYYTKFGFIPNPDGSFYDIGFGMLLGPINESVNTLINQLIDAGTLSNLQSGFLGKGLRLKMGEQRFQPGEWKPVNATGDDLKKQIVPLPAKDPSNVLFQLMGSMITSGKELASVAEIFVGKMPGQNTPATTTMASIEQGMKVFTAVYKRLYRSLEQEFKKLFDLNATYLNPETYQEVTGIETGPDDFRPGPDGKRVYRICPGADPTAVSQTEKLMKAQGLLELLPLGTLDPVQVTLRVLEAQEQPNYEQVLNQAIQQTGQMPPPPPDPKLQEMQMAGQLKERELQMKGQAMAQQSELRARDAQVQLAMKAQDHAEEAAHRQEMNNIERASALHKQRIFSAEAQQKTVQGVMEGGQKLQQKEAEHQQKMKQQKQQASAKPQPKGSTKK